MNKHSATADLHEAAPLTGLALSNWMRTLVDYVRSGEPDLTNRQMALMMIVYILPGPHTVRGLADKLNVSKPVITRALNKLGALGYLRRERDRSEEHTSELQSLMRISYAVLCLKTTQKISKIKHYTARRQ